MTAIDPAPLDPADIHPRYRGYAGFVTTPRYFDDSPQQFLAVAPAGVGVIQRVLHIPGYAYELDDENLWLSDDGLIAGAPALDALSDEALLQFLDELDVGGAGGSA